jgi:putative transcriptional regulator
LPLRRYLPHGLAGARWLFAGLGVSVAHVPLHPNTPSRLMLMRMQAGRRSEVHSHDGQELMLVLSGAYRDEFGAYKVGDLADMEGDVEHAPTALDDQECICVVAVGGPMTFKSKFIQMLAPILRL